MQPATPWRDGQPLAVATHCPAAHEERGDMTPTSRLAALFTARSWEQLPDDQLAQMRRLVLDYLGVALSGSRTESGRIARRFASENGGNPQSSIIGQPGLFPSQNAAFANAVCEHSIELDDVDEDALFHYGPPVVSAAIAVAQAACASGSQFIRALIAGCEMMSRVSRATNNALRDRGFHTTPSCGAFGATVAAGLLLKLTTEELTSALGLAGAQASGLMEMYGPSMQKRFNPGPAARAGVTSARMAQLGFTGTDRILDGPRGFGTAFAGGLDLEKLLDGLGTAIPVTVEHKPYSAARPIHNGIDCALEIRAKAKAPADHIAEIVIRRHPDWSAYHLNSAPTSFHEAQVSLPYSVAVALTLGAALPAQYADEFLWRDDLRSLAARVRVEEDESLLRGVSCDMTVSYQDGSHARAVVDYPKGSVQNPMSDDEIDAKFRGLTAGILTVHGAALTIESVRRLEEISDINEILSAVESETIA